jgi:hypothetical protein
MYKAAYGRIHSLVHRRWKARKDNISFVTPWVVPVPYIHKLPRSQMGYEMQLLHNLSLLYPIIYKGTGIYLVNSLTATSGQQE